MRTRRAGLGVVDDRDGLQEDLGQHDRATRRSRRRRRPCARRASRGGGSRRASPRRASAPSQAGCMCTVSVPERDVDRDGDAARGARAQSSESSACGGRLARGARRRAPCRGPMPVRAARRRRLGEERGRSRRRCRTSPSKRPAADVLATCCPRARSRRRGSPRRRSSRSPGRSPRSSRSIRSGASPTLTTWPPIPQTTGVPRGARVGDRRREVARAPARPRKSGSDATNSATVASSADGDGEPARLDQVPAARERLRAEARQVERRGVGGGHAATCRGG